MPFSSGDDTQVVAKARVGKLVRCRAKKLLDPILALLLSAGSFQKVLVG